MIISRASRSSGRRKFGLLLVAGAVALVVAGGLPSGSGAAAPAFHAGPESGTDDVRGRVAVEIGGEAGIERTYHFPELTSMVLGPDGRLYVAEARWGEVRAFDPDGRHAFTVDPATGGLRRFVDPRGLLFDAEGRLWVESPHQRDILSLEGSRTVERERVVRADLREDAPFPVAFSARVVGGQVVTRAGFPPSDDPATPPVQGLVAVGPTGGAALLHPVPDLPPWSGETMIWTEPERRPEYRLEVPAPFWEEPLWAMGPDGSVAAVVTSRYRILRVSGHGTALPPIEGPPLDPIPVTEADREAWLEPLSRRGVVFEGLTFTEFHPPIRRMAYDEAGRLWVELTRPLNSPDRVAHVFGPDGALLHTARWPADVELLTRSRPLLLEDRAWGIRTLPDGASQIVRIDWER